MNLHLSEKLLSEFFITAYPQFQDELFLLAVKTNQIKIVRNLVLSGYNLEKDMDTYGDNSVGENALETAVDYGHLEIVDYLIEQGVNPEFNKRYDRDWHLADSAVSSGHLHIAKYLVDLGMFIPTFNIYVAAGKGYFDIVKYLEPDTVNHSCRNQALCNAAENGHLSIVRFLVEKGINPNVNDGEALLKSAKKGHLGVVKFLLEQGINVKKFGGKALNESLKKGHFEIVKSLVEKGADVHKIDSDHIRSLTWLFSDKYNPIDIVEYLLKLDVYLYDNNARFLEYVAERGRLDLVQIMIKKNEDWSLIPDATPVHSAAQNGHIKVVRFLVEQGFDINAENPSWFYHHTPLAKASENGHFEIVKYLVEQGADVNKGSNHDINPLSSASKNGHFEIVKYLTEKGANIHIKYEYALRSASEKGHLEIVKYLIHRGADIHTSDQRYSSEPDSVETAIGNNQLEIVKYFVELGENLYTEKREKIIIHCAEWGYLDMVKYLIKNGFDIHTDDEKPLCQAAKRGHLNVVKYIVGLGGDIHAQNDKPLQKACDSRFVKPRVNLDIVKFLVCKGGNLKVISKKKLQTQMKYYKKYKEVMDSCIERIHFDPNLERTKTEQLDGFQDFKECV